MYKIFTSSVHSNRIKVICSHSDQVTSLTEKKKKKQPAGKIIKQKATTHTMQDMEDVPRPRQNSIDATYF